MSLQKDLETALKDPTTGIPKLVSKFESPNMDLLESAFKVFSEAFKRPIADYINTTNGKNISVILNSLFKDVIRCYAGEEPYLEKYIMTGNNPIIKSDVKTEYRFSNINEEMRYLFEIIGIKRTILLYSLVCLHSV